MSGRPRKKATKKRKPSESVPCAVLWGLPSDGEKGASVRAILHDMGVVARLADDVAVMSHGKIVEQGDVETLFNAPKHAVTRSLVSAHLALYGMELAS